MVFSGIELMTIGASLRLMLFLCGMHGDML
jgi:hypothetical protein